MFAEPNTLLTRVDALLGPETGLYKRGYHLATHALRLFFNFPQIARARYLVVTNLFPPDFSRG